MECARRTRASARVAMLLGLVAGFLFATSVQAGPINASETVLGDFYGQLLGSVGVGTNSVSGTLGTQDPSDSFQLTLGAGYNIASVGLQVTNPGFGGFSAISALGGGSGGGSSFTFTLNGAATDWQADINVTYIAASNPVRGCMPGQACSSPSNPIPEPSAALIFGLGALVVGTASRRRLN